uniref:Thioredoxin-like protein AAED1, chloroplastic n=1 Tax=Vitis vinifera TaxID=29760 RepID=F6HRJ0_VITVI
MAVIASAQTLHVLQPRSVSSPQSRRFPPRFPRAPHVKTSLSLKSTEAPNIRHSLLVRASSTSDFNPDIGEILGEVSVFTASGESVLFKDLWDQKEGVAVVALLRHFGCFCCWELASALKESKARFDSAGVKLIAVGVGTPNKACILAERGMAVVALLRHFGCPCCWDLASALKESKERFDSAGVKLIAVGVGTPDKARILAERLPFPLDCLYADPDRKAYDVLGLYYGFGRTFFNPASAKVLLRFEALQKAVKNYTIKATPDDKSSVLQQGGMFVFKGKQLVYARKDEGTGDHAPLDDVFDVCCKVPVA